MVRIDIHIHGGDDPTGEILRLARLIRTDLGRVLTQTEQIMATEADLDAALAQLSTDLSENAQAITDAVARVQAKLDAAGTPVDLSDEIAAVTAASSAIDGASAQLATLAPDAPTP